MESNSEKFVQLVRQNPCLDIVPMVCAAVVQSDDWAYWKGSFGKPSVEEYVCVEERIYIKSLDFEEAAEDIYSNWDLDDRRFKDKTEDEINDMAEAEVEALPWRKAIIVFVEEA